mmetsp:Transcript_48006/g.129421  ORF Transcript_48006/g.129421 Transcript_48006/m.129421 type:complete len:85 (+) Transcript_48006:3454-3708(+)
MRVSAGGSRQTQTPPDRPRQPRATACRALPPALVPLPVGAPSSSTGYPSAPLEQLLDQHCSSSSSSRVNAACFTHRTAAKNVAV